MTEEKKIDPKAPILQAIPALVEPVKAEDAVVLSQAPPMTLTGPKPVMDKPKSVVPSQFHLLK